MGRDGALAFAKAESESGRIPAGARHARILELVTRNGSVSVAVVAEAFAVSDMTIRRDLGSLERNGKLPRTHGGAVGVGRHEVFDAVEPAFSRRRRRDAIAKAAIRQLRQFYVDNVSFGVSGVTEDGLFDYSPDDTGIKHAFIEQSEQVVVLCDSSKFGHRSIARIRGLGCAGKLITEAAPPRHIADALGRAGVDIVIAPPLDKAADVGTGSPARDRGVRDAHRHL